MRAEAAGSALTERPSVLPDFADRQGMSLDSQDRSGLGVAVFLAFASAASLSDTAKGTRLRRAASL
ncbi:hypothetical protein ABZY93_00555 [Streptomyces smyrnaeus]|uniref:hypothetical protein n=1 Tax=Streptomyces smyrnaeus TaxID=1387713 RepID=UPI0033A95BB9